MELSKEDQKTVQKAIQIIGKRMDREAVHTLCASFPPKDKKI